MKETTTYQEWKAEQPKECEWCFEKEMNCICRFVTCRCGKKLPDGQMYEYRGVMGCENCIDKITKERDEQRERVMEITEASVKSQRTGEFVNNSKKYNLSNVMPDGLPIVKINEPQALKDYEDGKL